MTYWYVKLTKCETCGSTLLPLCTCMDVGFVTQFFVCPFSHRVGGNRKRYQQLTNADQKSIETVLSIAICRQLGDKW